VRILLLSAYDAGSHRRWREGVVAAFPEHDWTVLTLPDRHFSWRIRGNSLSWAFAEQDLLSQPYDRVLATSVVDLASLRGFVPSLSQARNLLYFHENQFAYPDSGRQHRSVEPQIVNLYSALAADQVLFNSNHNRETFLQGVQALLRRLPDAIPSDIVPLLKAKSRVLPVPLEDSLFELSAPVSDAAHAPEAVPELVWNHRWEYDKGPDRLLAVLQLLEQRKVVVRAHIVGQQFRRQPEAFANIAELLDQAHYLIPGHWGYMASRDEYRQLLQRCDMVLSTALHDFQGLAIMDAVAAGCIPVVPDRLAYPEFFSEAYCYAVSDDTAVEAAAAVGQIQYWLQQGRNSREAIARQLNGLRWSVLRDSYASALLG